MRFGVVTLFPELVTSALAAGVVSRGIERGLVSVQVENPRNHAPDVHRTVDARPYGGGPGMVMMPGPLVAATRALSERVADAWVVCLSPQGACFDQRMAERWLARGSVVLIAGRYEGIDERVVESVVDEEVSLGDFVLSGGEFAALTMIDAVSRLVPGVLGHARSAAEDSFGEAVPGGPRKLEGPIYTRPEEFEGRRVPSVLLSGDHAAIRRWRAEQADERTRVRRPDLISVTGEESAQERSDALRVRLEAPAGPAERQGQGKKESEQD